MSKHWKVKNDAGDVIKLSRREESQAGYWEKTIQNALGYEVSITTLTAISKKVSEQRFYHVAPAMYCPMIVGEGTWSTNMTTYRSFDVADEFETGIINTGGQNGRLASADAGVDAVNYRVFPWAKEISYSIFDLEYASRSGNWDLVVQKQKALKRNWDLGIQKIVFLGADGSNSSTGPITGLLAQQGVVVNTSVITSALGGQSVSALKTTMTQLVEAYRSNVQRNVYPTHFIIPESDWNSLASMASPDFPVKTVLEILSDMFKLICQNPNFKILPLAYADAAYHASVSSIAGKQVYTLLNYDEESLKVSIPLDFTNTQANSLNNFQFQSVGYGQFTGVQVMRPLEMLYFQF